MNEDTSLIGYMAQHLAALSAQEEWNQAHGCFQPTVTSAEVSYATSCVELTQHDVADSLDVIGQLLLNYPAEDIGDAPHRLQQTGRLLRVLGGALDLANEVAECAADQQHRHNMLSRVKPAQASQANKTVNGIEVQEQLHQVRQVKTSANEGRAAQ
ncbi:hypothetical protein CFN79_00885 [Chromobacterium vaccinii]|uniref:hypothetical protein n=1 Tax=Chromobacterium vaccinii TaxID=1108595 RepID=UPI000CE97DD5|nr:hypothetical protein [Chromobacterium vaccinii]AVG14542.1 hypothetical protein CFN79_00885 [Chromobacterium vaccinii]